MATTETKIHRCPTCGKRLPISELVGSVSAWCKECKAAKRVSS